MTLNWNGVGSLFQTVRQNWDGYRTAWLVILVVMVIILLLVIALRP